MKCNMFKMGAVEYLFVTQKGLRKKKGEYVSNANQSNIQGCWVYFEKMYQNET